MHAHQSRYAEARSSTRASRLAGVVGNELGGLVGGQRLEVDDGCPAARASPAVEPSRVVDQEEQASARPPHRSSDRWHGDGKYLTSGMCTSGARPDNRNTMKNLRGNPVRIRLAVAAALLLAGSGGIVQTVGVAAEAAAPPAAEDCHDHPSGGAALFSPGDSEGLSAPTDPLQGYLDGALDPATVAATTTLSSTPIATWFHVITEGPGTDVTDAQIAEQLAVLNQAFGGSSVSATTPFSFVHAGTDRTENPDWYGPEFTAGSPAEREAKTVLRQGGASTLNVYVTQTDGASWGRFPEWYRWSPELDGIVVNRANFAGGSSLTNGAGDIAVHEVGHWMGLWHTFQGGCEGGDHVEDTPAQAAPSETGDCVVPQDTCVAPGTDPVHNYMNYIFDLCADRFTVGQSDRMKAQWTKYRAPSGGGGSTKPGKGNGRK